MAFESIRLSALGRDVSVGNFYNYFTEDYFKSDIQVPEKSLRIQTTTEVARNFFFQQPDKFRGCMLGINSHFDLNTEQSHLDKSDLWLSEYLESSYSLSKIDVAEVIVIFRVIKRIETLDQGFLESKMSEYQLNSRGRATHLVEEVVYGTEIICSMWRQIDKSSETKESAEGSIYLVAKDYFDQAIGPNFINYEIPTELKKISCKILSSHDIDHNLEGSFSLSSEWLKNTINISTDSNFEKWRPIEIALRLIPDQVQVRILSERRRDVAIQKERNEAMLIWIEKESRAIWNLPTFPINTRVPRLDKSIGQFVALLEPLREEIEKLYHMLDIKQHGPEKFLSEIQTIYELLIDMTEWLIFRRREIDVISSILKGTSLNILDLEEIETLSRDSHKCAKVFMLQFSDNLDPLVERIQKFVKKPEPVAKLPFFQIASSEKKRIEEVKKKLIQYADEAQLNRSSRETTYYIGLVPISSSMNDGTVTEVGYNSLQTSPIDQEVSKPQGQLTNESPLLDTKLSPDELKQLIEKSMIDGNRPLSKTDYADEGQEGPLKQENEIVNKDCVIEVDNPVRSDDLPTNSDRTEGIPKSQQLIDLSETIGEKNLIELEHMGSISDINGSNIVDVTLGHQSNPLNETEFKKKANEESSESSVVQTIIADRFDKSPNIREISNDTCNIISSSDKIKRDQIQTDPFLQEEDTQSIAKQGSEKETDRKKRKEITETELDGDRCPPGLTLAQFFAQEGNKYSQLINRGQPNVFLLNAQEKSHDVNFKTIDIGRPNGPNVSFFHGNKNHKVLILMGATGCGKSTLINGMVNYILGVRWDDSFRFKCVREDESAARNQALSQTSSVTAYTIHHREGMNVPYSITIIDTPGYGDTRGIGRDKEITKMIHRFLIKSRIDEIHAACFVACSGNSRLTATQGYILDSVLSIFGKDFKDNIRLLVTFADNADPPVVEACRVAHFPVTSPSGEIAYSKFNSSVLYASNVQQDDDFSFDQLFWEMGQENFKKFFTMLEGMNGKNLASTREVIHRRQLLERSLKNIEKELEECLDKIEKIENFQRKLREYGHKMNTNKNFEIEETETRLSRFNCDEGFVAYNCLQCKRTCDGPFKKKNKPKKTKCNTPLCSCPVSEHDFQQFELRPKRVTTKKTLLDMKAEYNLNFDGKVSTEQLIEHLSEDLTLAKAKVFSLLDQVDESVLSLESTALRSNTLSPADYLSLMRSRVAEEQKPGYMTRLETLAELQRSLAPPVQGTLHESSSYTGGGIGHSRVSSATTTRRDETGGGGSWSHERGNSTFDSSKTVGSHRQSHPPYGNTNKQSTTSFENDGQATRYVNDYFSREDNYDSCSFI